MSDSTWSEIEKGCGTWKITIGSHVAYVRRGPSADWWIYEVRRTRNKEQVKSGETSSLMSAKRAAELAIHKRSVGT